MGRERKYKEAQEPGYIRFKLRGPVYRYTAPKGQPFPKWMRKERENQEQPRTAEPSCEGGEGWKR